MAGLLLAAGGVASAAETVSAPAVAAAPAPASARADFAGETASADARFAANWVMANADNQRMPFVVVDKKGARAFVFGADGQLRGATPVLLGLGLGDASVPGIARRELSSLRPDERTTPSGRFIAEPGHNVKGEDIVWVDYDAKIAIHRLRPDLARERRAQRLASPGLDDKRISMGCIVVPVSFYENVVRPVLGKNYSVVYVLPESRSVQAMFGALEASLNKP